MITNFVFNLEYWKCFLSEEEQFEQSLRACLAVGDLRITDIVNTINKVMCGRDQKPLIERVRKLQEEGVIDWYMLKGLDGKEEYCFKLVETRANNSIVSDE